MPFTRGANVRQVAPEGRRLEHGFDSQLNACLSLGQRSHLCMHSTLLSNERKLSEQLIRFTGSPAQETAVGAWLEDWTFSAQTEG